MGNINIAKYNFTIKNTIIAKNNLYNPNTINCPFISINSVFNTFKTEKNIKLIKLYLIVFLIGGQRPVLKRIKFVYIKKKILKRFFIVANLHQSGNLNSYLTNFYIYFFHIYYQKKLKYNFFKNSFNLYIDNIQLFFKNYNKQNHKTQVKVTWILNNKNSRLFYVFLNNLFLFKIKDF